MYLTRAVCLARKKLFWTAIFGVRSDLWGGEASKEGEETTLAKGKWGVLASAGEYLAYSADAEFAAVGVVANQRTGRDRLAAAFALAGVVVA